jgi:hypothetical protein
MRRRRLIEFKGWGLMLRRERTSWLVIIVQRQGVVLGVAGWSITVDRIPF